MRLNMSVLLLLSCFCLSVHGGEDAELQSLARGAEPKGERPQTPEDLFRPVQSAEEVDIVSDEPDLEANAVNNSELARFLWPHVKRRVWFCLCQRDCLCDEVDILEKTIGEHRNQPMHVKLCQLYESSGQGGQPDDFDEVVKYYRNEYPRADVCFTNCYRVGMSLICVGLLTTIIYAIVDSV